MNTLLPHKKSLWKWVYFLLDTTRRPSPDLIVLLFNFPISRTLREVLLKFLRLIYSIIAAQNRPGHNVFGEYRETAKVSVVRNQA
jgi:hypothetical protein